MPNSESYHGCGGTLTDEIGHFSSPNIKESLQCEWLIRVPVGKKIQVKFLSFGIENHKDFKCMDYISLYDGGSTFFPMLGRYCGYILPPNHVSSGNQLLIRFKSENHLSSDGFKIVYQTLPINGGVDSMSNISSIHEMEAEGDGNGILLSS